MALKERQLSNFKSKRNEGSGNELVDYSRAPCLGADQKARGLWERDWLPELSFRQLVKGNEYSGNEIGMKEKEFVDSNRSRMTLSYEQVLYSFNRELSCRL